MNIESQVCSLELAKRLKGIGINDQSFFHWVEYKDKVKLELTEVISDYCIECFNAYTVAELGEMLKEQWFSSNFIVALSKWRTDFVDPETARSRKPTLYADTEADCRAKALIWCIENGLAEV